MAKAGTFSALQQVKPIQEDFSDNLTTFRQQQIQEERFNYVKQRDQQQRQDKLNREYSEDIAGLIPVITGVQTVDEINYRATAAARARMGEIYRTLRENPNAANAQELALERANLTNFPKLLQALQQRMIEYSADFTKGYSEGKYSAWDKDSLEVLEALFGYKDKETGTITPNYIIDFDKRGDMQLKMILPDKSYREVSANQILNGHEFSTPTLFQDSNEYIKEQVDLLGKNQNVMISNNIINTYQEFSGEMEKEVRNLVRSNLGDADNPSGFAKTMWADEDNMNRDKKEFSEKSVKEIEDWLVDRIKMGYDKTTATKRASQGKDTRSTMEKKAASMRQGITKTEENLWTLPEALKLNVGDKEARFHGIEIVDNKLIAIGKSYLKNPDEEPEGGKDKRMMEFFKNQKNQPKYERYSWQTHRSDPEMSDFIAKQIGYTDTMEAIADLRGEDPKDPLNLGLND